MEKKITIKKKKKCNKSMVYLSISMLTAAVVLVTILEGRRVKKENELLSYEVW